MGEPADIPALNHLLELADPALDAEELLQPLLLLLRRLDDGDLVQARRHRLHAIRRK